jgi:hypothetical protein
MNAVQFSGTFKIHNSQEVSRASTIINNAAGGPTIIPTRADGFFGVFSVPDSTQDSKIIENLHKAKIQFRFKANRPPKHNALNQFLCKALSCFK